jgi:putative ABC transport system ATP-binding protein
VSQPAEPPPAIAAHKVAKSYGEPGSAPVLADLDMSVARGQLVALIGKSGTGKSTLLNLLAGIDQPTRGEIELGGTALTRMSEDERTRFRRDHIGFVFQFFNLLPTLTVAENVLLPIELKRGRLDAAAAARVEALLAAVGLEGQTRRFPDSLSGGEKQRVAVARALAHDPDLILADEPTGNLDAATGRAVLELLVKLSRAEGRTVVVVSHSGDVIDYADRVLTLAEGRLREG